VMIRTSSRGEVMVVISFFREDPPQRTALLTALLEAFPGITSLMYVINQKGNDTITDQKTELFHGKDHIVEEMGDLKFKVGPKSFYQTNSEQAYNLYQTALRFAGLTGDEVVYDLYTGTGTIANFVARQAQKVIGIEYVPEAIADAKENARLNGIENTRFFSGDIREVMDAEFLERYGRPDVIITDPPRAGMHGDVIRTLLEILPRKIVYVSCNPATQARDLSLLSNRYTVTKVQPVDMFPHTHHVENVVLLEKHD
jgi:23S rRNA (uracil1939-C5)-methyltransferase